MLKLKIITLSLLVFCIVGIGNAEISIGFKGGVNLATINGDDWNDDDKVLKPGINLGVPIEIKVAKMFSIQPEVVFSSKGIKYVEEYDYEFTAKEIFVLQFYYLEAPVLFKFVIPAGRFFPNLYVAPTLSFRVAVDGYEIEEYGDEKDKYDFDSEDKEWMREEFNPIDFGITFGGGLGIEVGPGNIVFDARYTMGFFNVEIDDPDPSRNGNISFLLGYTFNIGRE